MADCIDGICGGSPPGVAPHPETGRAWLVGTTLHVDEVLGALEEDGSHARVAGRLGLTLHQVRIAGAWSESIA